MKTVPTNREHTKNQPPRFTCHGCERTAANGCSCLTDWRIVRRMREAVAQLLVKGADPTRSDRARAESRRIARQRLARLAELATQAEREYANYWAFRAALLRRPANGYSARRDADALEYMMGDHIQGNAMPLHSVEQVAAAFGRPVSYVKELRNRCLRAMAAPTTEEAKVIPLIPLASRKTATRKQAKASTSSRRAA